jgi:hypothetical protein
LIILNAANDRFGSNFAYAVEQRPAGRTTWPRKPPTPPSIA